VSLITKIARLKHPGVLRDFTWPADLPSFGRFNLIYGWNGSGKTTLSRVFRAIEQRVACSSGEVTLLIDGHHVTGQDFPKTTVPVRVFNRDFVNENVFPVSGGEVPPIFVVGKESVEKQKEVDRLKLERTAKEITLQQARSAHQQAEREFNQHCVDRARVIKDTLRVPGPGSYNDYNKANYRTRAEQMAAAGDGLSHRLADADRDSLLIQHRANVRPKVASVSYRFPLLQQLHGETAGLLSATVTSAAIESLKDDPALSDWVRHGLGLHKKRAAATCLFCEQSLPGARLSALESHFSAEYDRFIERIDRQRANFNKILEEVKGLRLPDRMALYDDLSAEYESRRARFLEALERVSGFVGDLLGALEEKKNQPFKSIPLEVAIPTIDENTTSRLNEVIARHNAVCDDFQGRTTNARDRLALDLIAQSLDDYSRLAAAVKAALDAIGPLEQDVKRLVDDIGRLEREIVEHRQPAEELNEDLRKYLGHDEFKLQVKETGYQLLRHSHPAEALSEGERTALALLYFLKSLRDRRFDLRHGVVVLDDPVSSLDANALYLAFGFIRYRTQEAGQLLVLTHNFTFFRQVRNWFHHQKGQNKKDINQRPARFYMLDRVHGSNARCTTLRALDPLLEQYESEYHYLFACVHRAANAKGETELEQNYGLPNVARRLLEMFLAFRRPQIAGELGQKLKDVSFEEAKKVRIVRFVHTHSHGDTVGEPEHDPSLLGEARAVLADLLELIKSEDAQHFTAMVGLVSGPPPDTESE
jgi:wobble nucleotide-excising tRNase